ncbi:gamma-glutamyl-gamma-aminobutyrate hydrolase family protein [Salinisphaera hydrothermalis]|uniref:Peptidase C26 n=1 Tax=Salinisphaera hydrothermalis (strain C41B8) TaxID=1304275 RepID=A0A084IKP4_SALHC|nr:type 1 glutamine amidotransferase [Salinisphaera hydrothermalis]KEZ77278.1 peptidase C26 [Salinisphaera hydrothermalis C41B8]
MSRPRIAVTGKASRWAPGWWCAGLAIVLAGGWPVRATPTRPWPRDVAGVVIGGGDDIASDWYAASVETDQGADRARDAFELEAIRVARAGRQPILGICRGAQLLNVAAGGSLHADITPRRRSTSARANPLPCKTIVIRSATGLARVLGVSRLRVNGLHHQAVDRLGQGLIIAARDADGFVQAIEDRAGAPVLGVQWHPEYLIYRRASRRLFTALVTVARQRGS